MEIREKLYTSLVRPHLEFLHIAWFLRLEKGRNIRERLHLKELEYEERLKRMDSPSLTYRRARVDMTDTYKYARPKYIVNKDVLVRNEDSVT